VSDPALVPRIEHFVGYYTTSIERRRRSPRRAMGRRSQALLVSVVDALASAVYPNRQNRDRFTRILERFGEWKHASWVSTRISVPCWIGRRIRNSIRSGTGQRTDVEVGQWAALTPSTTIGIRRRSKQMAKDATLAKPVGMSLWTSFSTRTCSTSTAICSRTNSEVA